MLDKLVYSVCLEINIDKTKEEYFDPNDPYFILKSLIFSISSIRGIKPSLDIAINKLVEKINDVIKTITSDQMQLKYKLIKEKCIDILENLKREIAE